MQINCECDTAKLQQQQIRTQDLYRPRHIR